MPLTRLKECWPLPMESLPELPKNSTYNSLLTVQWKPSACRSCQCCPKKKRIIKSLWLDLLCLTFLGLGEPAYFHWELCFLVSGSYQSLKNFGIWTDHLDHPPAVMTMSLFLIFSEHPLDKLRANLRIFSSSRIIVRTVPTLTSNCALIVSMDTRRSLSMKFFIWPIKSGVLTSLLLPHLSSSLTDSLPSLNLLCHLKTDARFMQDGRKAIWSIPYVSVAFFPSLKQNFIAYRSSKVSSRSDWIFEIHQLWQPGFSRVYSNCCCSWSFESEIIEIGQSSHKIYSNNILNIQESTTILKILYKWVWKLIEGTS